MTPKQKAFEIALKMVDKIEKNNSNILKMPLAKQCALIAVDEIINSHPQSPMTFEGSYKYWEQVKAEIEKL